MLRITHRTPQPNTQQRCSYTGFGYVLVGGRGVDEAEGIIKREVKRGGRVLASPKSITRDCGAEKVPCPISCFISKWKCDYRETLPGNITSSPITYSYQEWACVCVCVCVCLNPRHSTAGCQIVPLISPGLYYHLASSMCVSFCQTCFLRRLPKSEIKTVNVCVCVCVCLPSVCQITF